MTTQTAVRETARDALIISVFGFWAVMLGLAPVIAIHALLA
jgi:hypothetical protein